MNKAGKISLSGCQRC